MKKFDDIKKMFEDFPIPLHDEQSFLDEDEQIPIPYMYYYATNSNNLLADGEIYLPIIGVCIRLVTNQSNFKQNRKVEEILRQNGIVYDTKVNSVSEEQVFVTDYSFDVLL